MTSVSWREPAVAVRAAREAVKVEKAGLLSRMVGDVGQVQAKAGTQRRLRRTEARERPARYLAAGAAGGEEGGKTRAILKLLGRAAIPRRSLRFNLTSG